MELWIIRMAVLLGLFAFLLPGCGNTNNQNVPPSLGGGSGGNGVSGSDGNGTSSTSPTVPTPVSNSTKQYATTTGGYVTSPSQFSFPVESTENLKGVTTDGTSLYILTSIYVTYNST